MITRSTPSETEYPFLDTEALRDAFLVEDLFVPGKACFAYTDIDRAVVGTVCPQTGSLTLAAPEALRADYFCQRREIGVINLGGSGAVDVDGTTFDLGNLDVLYIGRGSRDVAFRGAGAQFYAMSYPAHTKHPTTRMTRDEAAAVAMGSPEEANERVIHQYIHEGGIRSCQLVLGFTELKTGSVWNTMPCHTHARRSEVYCYFDVPEDHAVLHLMGTPDETRPLWLHDRQAVLSPSWSIHCGSGTAAYRFVWAMGGENQRFDDMDAVAIKDLR